MKSRLKYLYISLLIVVMVVFAMLDSRRPKAFVTSPDYRIESTYPLGCAALKDLYGPIAGPDSPITVNDLSVYEAVFEIASDFDHGLVNFIVVNHQLQNFDEFDTEALLSRVRDGDNVFMAAMAFSQPLTDSLRFEITYDLRAIVTRTMYDIDSLTAVSNLLELKLTNPSFGPETSIKVEADFAPTSFSAIDSTTTEVLGVNEYGNPNFIRITEGDGYVYVHANPMLFTNYNLLNKDRTAYMFAALSYLPQRRTHFDNYYKVGKPESSGALSLVFGNDYLRTGWYTLVGSFVLFVLFFGRRWQRVVPIIKRPENTTLEFAGIIASMYLNRQDHANIARKRISYLKEYFRARLGVGDQPSSEGFVEKVALRSGIQRDKIAHLVAVIGNIERRSKVSATDLKNLNMVIEHFYQNTQR